MADSYITEKIRRGFSELPYLVKAARLVWSIAPYQVASWMALLVVGGLLPVASIYLLRALVDAINTTLTTNGSYQLAGTLLLALGGIHVLLELHRVLSNYQQSTIGDIAQDANKERVFDRAVTLDLAAYEDPERYNQLHRAHSNASSELIALLGNAGGLLQGGVTLIAMAAVLVPYAWWLPLALIGSTVPAFLVVLSMARAQHAHWLKTTSDERRALYYESLATDYPSAAEIRLFGLGKFVVGAYRDLRRGIREQRRSLERRRAILSLAAGLIALVALGGSVFWMALQLHQSTLSLGDLAFFYQAFQQGQSIARSVLQNLAQIYKNSLYLRDLVTFLESEPNIVAPPAPLPVPTSLSDGIRFSGVAFSYPGTERAIYRDLDLVIPAGRITAILGVNGAGKSTLIKLLCRFYDPSAGSVMLDGQDIRSFDPAELRRRITVLFQEPYRFHETALQNIAFGDHPTVHDREAIHRAATVAEAHSLIAELPDGYATMLGRSFSDGVELSGGQWQRIALARAFLRDAPIIVLDEPTSAMDSWTEAEWLSRFKQLARDRTVLIITHRMDPARLADHIYVMDHGSVIESGSHPQLIKQDGRYAESWRRHTEG